MEILRRELDADPDSKTTRLFAQIKDQDVAPVSDLPLARSSQLHPIRLELPDKPSIAVLPFENMRAIAEDDYFADGITDSIISALGKFRWFFVIARNSSFAFKRTTASLRDVAHQLGVRYILRGTIQRYQAASDTSDQARVRVSTELIDAGPGYLVWSDRYDRGLRNVPSMQDEITQSVIAAVFPQFLAAEAQRAHRKDPGTLDVWDNLMRGRWHLWRFNRSEPWPGAPKTMRVPHLGPKAGPMPSHDRLWPNQSDAASDVGKQAIDPDEEPSIQAAQSNSLWDLPAKNDQLMTKDQNLSFKASPRLEPSRNYSKKQANKVKHHLEA